jgi:hypothetical protein
MQRDVLYNHVWFPVSEPIDCTVPLQPSVLLCLRLLQLS